MTALFYKSIRFLFFSRRFYNKLTLWKNFYFAFNFDLYDNSYQNYWAVQAHLHHKY